MPLAGFICDAEDMPVTTEACLACARAGALPGCHQTAPVIAGIVRGLRPDDFGLDRDDADRLRAQSTAHARI